MRYIIFLNMGRQVLKKSMAKRFKDNHVKNISHEPDVL